MFTYYIIVRIHSNKKDFIMKKVALSLSILTSFIVAHSGGSGNCFDINKYQKSTSLTLQLKESLAYMGNEERLAYDIYQNLYKYHLKENNSYIKQFKNISENSEIKHIKIVQDVVRRYKLDPKDLNNVVNPVANRDIKREKMPSGVYDVPAIQELYDALYAKGTQSKKDALEVGCMVEVTDVEDLNKYLKMAKESNSADVTAAFNVLRDGSYRHYWAFDSGLKKIGIEKGCCSLGTINGVNYCQPSYPKTEGGHGKGKHNEQNNQNHQFSNLVNNQVINTGERQHRGYGQRNRYNYQYGWRNNNHGYEQRHRSRDYNRGHGHRYGHRSKNNHKQGHRNRWRNNNHRYGQQNGWRDNNHRYGHRYRGNHNSHSYINVFNKPNNNVKISNEIKTSLEYMYDEERLAKDLYLGIYQKQPLRKFLNIATRGETRHIEAVKALAQSYSVATPYLQAGHYKNEKIQSLYNTLYAKGIKSEKDAYEVGCTVEVTDIDDLNNYINVAKKENKQDFLQTYRYLRRGSYNHYWSFDRGLKRLGISDGCCSLGQKYCHPEYPKKSRGRHHHRHGEGRGRGGRWR